MKISITLVISLIIIVCDVCYLRWASKEYAPSEGHNIEETNEIAHTCFRSHMWAIGSNALVICGLLYWNGLIGADVMVLVGFISAVIMYIFS